MKSHHQLVEEWKEQSRKEQIGYWGDNEPSEKMSFAVWQKENDDFLERAMLAAARGAAEAGKVEAHIKTNSLDMFSHGKEIGHNIAISQSERQLEDYFKEI